jgi:hypothetical protein
MADILFYIKDSDLEAFNLFMESLSEEDLKIREITASRIIDIDYEKKYLKHRIIRLCTIIGSLKIAEASSTLVKIFNYIKKYFDSELYYATALCLSYLNYPYMLSELELILSSNENNDIKLETIELLSQFSDPRSLIILLDYVRTNFEESNSLISKTMSVILKREMVKDKVANDTAKIIIENNSDPEISAKAVLIVGKTSFEKDIMYLHELLIESDQNKIKEAAVQAIQMIAYNNQDYKNKNIVPFLKGYLKDPAIKVRIFSCVFLLQLGDTGALTQLKDMMVIKNKDIQREILLILGNNISAPLAFFLLTLINEDYAISHDIIPLFYYLNDEDRKQIDYFVTNLF